MTIKQYAANIQFGSSMILILANGRIQIGADTELTPSEQTGLTLIAEILRKLRSDKNIEIELPATMLLEIEPIVQCEWKPNGKLFILDGVPSRKFKHAMTVTEALAAHRSFTCPRSIAQALPPERNQTMIEAARLAIIGERPTYPKDEGNDAEET